MPALDDAGVPEVDRAGASVPGVPAVLPSAHPGGEVRQADPAGSPDPAQEPELIVVGRIGRPQGIKGEVTVEVRTDDPDARFADGARLRCEPSQRGPLTIVSSRQQGRYLILTFAGVKDRNDAEQLRDTLLLVPVADLPPLPDEDEYYDTQLIGLLAQLPDGARLGDVTDVLHLPGGDVLVVARDLSPPPARAGGQDLLVPFVRAMVPVVDVPGGLVVVDPPPGLLELGEAPDVRPEAAGEAVQPDVRPEAAGEAVQPGDRGDQTAPRDEGAPTVSETVGGRGSAETDSAPTTGETARTHGTSGP